MTFISPWLNAHLIWKQNTLRTDVALIYVCVCVCVYGCTCVHASMCTYVCAFTTKYNSIVSSILYPVRTNVSYISDIPGSTKKLAGIIIIYSIKFYLLMPTGTTIFSLTLYNLSFWYQTSSSSSGCWNVASKFKSSLERDKIRRRDTISLGGKGRGISIGPRLQWPEMEQIKYN